MNRKFLIISACVILVLAIGTSIVLANFNSKENKVAISKDIIDIDDSYVKLNTDNSNEKSLSATRNENCIQSANNYLTTFNLTNKRINANDSKIEIYQNNLENRTELVISNSDMIMKLNNETGKLISFINNKTVFEENTLSNENIRAKAFQILQTVTDSEDYELIMLEPFDEEIYRAKFAKKYGDYINVGELISFSFAPQTSEIVTFAQKDIPFANNQIKINQEEARRIAEKYLENSTATEIESVTLKIVQPNHELKEALSSGKVYRNAPQTRLAYVFTFNNSAQTQLYVDCSTGETIGADKILGGDF